MDKEKELKAFYSEIMDQKRGENESYERYKERLKTINKAIKNYLKGKKIK